MLETKELFLFVVCYLLFVCFLFVCLFVHLFVCLLVCYMLCVVCLLVGRLVALRTRSDPWPAAAHAGYCKQDEVLPGHVLEKCAQ